MLTAMLAVQNMQGASHDLWAVNTDFEYHEEQHVERKVDLRAERQVVHPAECKPSGRVQTYVEPRQDTVLRR